jgi:glycerol-3-phosphate dehydrogenase (NAD(P)+)
VVLWTRNGELARVINEQHRNPAYLPGRNLHPSLRATTDPSQAIPGRELLVSAVPSQGVRPAFQAIASLSESRAVILGASKGLEIESLLRMSEVASACLPGRSFVAFSGPSFAGEMLDGQPTAVVAASTDEAAAILIQDLFTAGSLRVYTSPDLIGTELAGAFKNVIAIAAGMCEGLGLGSNPRAALITRGLAELTRLGTALGADPLTFLGLAGMGDLVLTCYGAQSRNHALGVALGQGESLDRYLERHHVVVEGVPTARVAIRLAQRAGVEMPIAAKVAECLFQGKTPRQAIAELMERTPKPEQWT